MDSYSLLPENEYKEVEGRSYLNPTLGVTQTNDFINNLRENQKTQNAQITAQTQNLGTNVPSDIGGLTGADSYFTSRYQTPQTNADIANLRSVAQAAALNQVLANEQEMWKKRYQDAYRAYQQRSWDKSYNSGSTGNAYGYEEGEDPEFVSTSSTVEPATVSGRSGYSTIVDPATGDIVDVPLEGDGTAAVRDANRYRSPGQAGYDLLGHPNRMGEAGTYLYNTPSGEMISVELDDGYRIVYDTETGKLVQIKE